MFGRKVFPFFDDIIKILDVLAKKFVSLILRMFEMGKPFVPFCRGILILWNLSFSPLLLNSFVLILFGEKLWQGVVKLSYWPEV